MNEPTITTTALLAILREAAENRGMSLAGWAKAAGMKRQQLDGYLNRGVDPGLYTFLRLAEAAGVEVKLI